MISAWWLLLAFWIGVIAGLGLIALCQAAAFARFAEAGDHE